MTKEEFIQYEKMSRDTIDVKRIYIDVAGDVVTGVLLSQIVFYYLPDNEGKTKLRVIHDNKLWIAKTREDWWEECRISPKQFDRSIKILEDKKIVTTKIMKFNGNPTKHIYLNLDVLINEIEKLNSAKNSEYAKPNLPKGEKPNQEPILSEGEIGSLPNSKNGTDQESVKSFLPKGEKPDKKPFLTKGENGFLPNGKNEIDQKAKTITEITTETTNRDPVPDSVSFLSRSSNNKLVTRSTRSLEKYSVMCSGTKIDNLSTYIPPNDIVSIIYNKPDISLKELDIKSVIEPDISLKVPVVEPGISIKEPDKERAIEPVNKPMVSTVAIPEDETGKILNKSLNEPVDELDIEPEMSFDVPNDELDISTIESEEDAYEILVRDGFIDPSDPDDPFRDLWENMKSVPYVEYTDEELEEILKKLNAGSSLNASCSEGKGDFERSEKILNNEQNKPKKDLFKPFSFDDFFGSSDKMLPDISQVLANKEQNNTSESTTGKNLNSSLNKPEKDTDNASDMPDDTLSEPDNVSVDDSDDDFFKLDDGLFESEEYKEFFAMLDAMSEAENARETSLETSHSDPDKEPETVPGQKHDTSLNAPERKLERNVIMPDADLIELENKPAGMDAEQTLQDSTDLQECLSVNDTDILTSAAKKDDCDTDSHGFHALVKDDVNKVQDNPNADSNAELMLDYTTEQGFESVPEGEEVNYGYGNWNDYSLEETDDDGIIISSGQFKQDCDAFLSDDVAEILAKDELSDDDIKILEEAGFSVVDEFDNTKQSDAEKVQPVDSTKQELVRILEEAFNAKVVDDADSASDMPEKHVNNTEQDFIKMLEEAFDAKVVDDTEKPDIKPVDELDTLPESFLSEPEKVTYADNPDKMPVAESGRSFNEPDEVLVAEPDVSIADTNRKPDKVRKAKVISLADRRKSLRQADKLENALDRRQIAFVNRHTNALQECLSCKNTHSLTIAAEKEKADELELAVNAGMCISSDPPPSREIFRNLLAVSKQEHRELTCEGGT